MTTLVSYPPYSFSLVLLLLQTKLEHCSLTFHLHPLFLWTLTVGLELATGVPILYKLDSDGKVVSKEILQG